MLALNTKSVLIFGALFALAAAPHTIAAEGTNSFQVVTAQEAMFGRQPLTRAYVTSGNKRFTFVVPDGFRFDASRPQEVLITNPDYSASISLKFAPQADVKTATPEALRKVAKELYPQAEVSEEFSLAADGNNGPAFDVRGKTSEGLVRSARISFVPCGGQLVEFRVVSSAEKFGSTAGELQTLMLTFRSSDVGTKPEVAILSERL
jgi:hypothetical protein